MTDTMTRPRPDDRTSQGVPGRRTIRIDSRPAPRRRPSPTAAQIVSKPDRVALWAVALGVFMVFMAIVTAHS